MNRLELAIAWRYLRSRRGSRVLSLISVIAIGGVVVGVSALIVIMGVMNGLQQDLREKILVGSPDLRVLPAGDLDMIEDWERLLREVERFPGVVAVAPFVQTQALVGSGHAYWEGANVVGIVPDAKGLVPVTTIRERADRGGDFRFEGASGAGAGVVLGSALASRLGVFPGDRIRMITVSGATESPVLGYAIPPEHSFEVTGIFSTGMYEYDHQYLYMSVDAAREIAGLGNAVSGLEVRTADRWVAPEVARRLDEALGADHRVEHWQETNRSLFQALQLEKLGMGVILLLIVVVAAFNIVSTLTMVVTDKTREIGILKTMGMSSRAIRRVFLGQGLVIGAGGTAVGVALGIIASHVVDEYRLIRLDASVYFIDHLPVLLDPADVVLTVIASVAIAAAATLYPARQAARLYPVEAIRHE
ncbi:MAG TPA: ABC transporter permease [Gemmatimonadaceae bacterium]|nr:ABC transporter permease [Gemmatimonadaceae bacterium]